MGFDKPKESKFIIPVSDIQACKQFGNAVVPPLIEHIANQMKKSLLLENIEDNVFSHIYREG